MTSRSPVPFVLCRTHNGGPLELTANFIETNKLRESAKTFVTHLRPSVWARFENNGRHLWLPALVDRTMKRIYITERL